MSNQTISERLVEDIKKAARGHSEDLQVLRMLKAALANEVISLRAQNKELTEANSMQIIRRESKRRKEAAQLYKEAGRVDLANKELAEDKVLVTYLPPAPALEDIKKQIIKLKNELALSQDKDRGKLTKAVLDYYQGSVDGGTVSALVVESLKN
ncbi:GatB/YqeY domain-containing protein [Patescibacteria group bacterium]|nr:GatB/YqeY domain-containing protein [Patescibacteria group bacterium]